MQNHSEASRELFRESLIVNLELDCVVVVAADARGAFPESDPRYVPELERGDWFEPSDASVRTVFSIQPVAYLGLAQNCTLVLLDPLDYLVVAEPTGPETQDPFEELFP